MQDVLQEREQILSTTIEDLRNYADAIDKLIAEKRVFLSANETQIKKSGFKASVTENMDDINSGK